MNEILPQPEEYLVTVDPDNEIEGIQQGNKSIPVCPGNRDYDTFVLVDTEAELCPRVLGHEYTNEAKMNVVRMKRNALLAQTDKTQFDDYDFKLAGVSKSDISTLRRALRSLPDDYPVAEDAEIALEAIRAELVEKEVTKEG